MRTLRAALALAAAALSFGAFAGPASAGAPRDFVGMTSEDVFAGSDDYREENLRAQAALRVGVIRQNFDWAQIERAPGQYDLSQHDRFVAHAATHGIRVLAVLSNAPAFHGRPSNGRGARRPRSNASFARFATVLARRYGPTGSLWRERPGLRKQPITSWQIWNEPNLPIYWQPRPNAAAYVKLMKAGARAIKRVHRRAEIVTAGLPPSKLRGAVSLPKFIRGMYRAGGKSAFDTLAINSYAKDHRELVRLVKSIRTLMNKSRDRRARIWITELGWAKGGPAHRFRVGEQGQATRIFNSFRALGKARKRMKLRGVVYYSWRDAQPYPPLYQDMWGLHTGLLTVDGRQSAGYHAFGKAVAGLR